MIGVTTAGGEMGWLLGPFLEATAPKFPGVEWRVMEDFPHPSNFSRRFIALLEGMDDPVFLWSPADVFVDRAVEPGVLEFLGGRVAEQGNVVRFGLAEVDWPHEVVDRWGTFDVARCADLSACSLVAGAAFDSCLFDRKNLLKVLEPRWTVWEAEARATEKVLADPSLASLSVFPGLFRRVDLHSHLNGCFWHLEDLTPGDREIVLGHVPEGVEWRS